MDTANEGQREGGAVGKREEKVNTHTKSPLSPLIRLPPHLNGLKHGTLGSFSFLREAFLFSPAVGAPGAPLAEGRTHPWFLGCSCPSSLQWGDNSSCCPHLGALAEQGRGGWESTMEDPGERYRAQGRAGGALPWSQAGILVQGGKLGCLHGWHGLPCPVSSTQHPVLPLRAETLAPQQTTAYPTSGRSTLGVSLPGQRQGQRDHPLGPLFCGAGDGSQDLAHAKQVL